MLNIHSPKEELIHAMDKSLLESVLSEKEHPSLELVEHDGLILMNTGIHSPDMNGIFQGHTPCRDVVESVEYAIRFFAKRQMPYYWWVGKHRNPNISDLLEESGFEHIADLPVMVVSLEKLPTDIQLSNIRIKTVETMEEFEDWIMISEQCVELEGQAVTEYWDYNRKYDYEDIQTQEFFLGYWDGIPVASCTTFKNEDIAVFYFIATLPEYRSKGIGRAITLHAMKKARDEGYHVGGLQATPMGLSLYEKLGFETISYEYIYKYKD
ncbi:MAG TPA: GNAT family N-acetyltransferase [Candidatus Cloacimonadota bacterium]|nr:GNAT family N-acetyltransferase [Candidatus Cloacimonadota bacterium]